MNTRLHHLAEAHNARFGTSGVRGLVSDLSDAVCYAYAQAFLRSIATDSARVVVGHDLRPSSPRIAAACIQAIRDAGREAVFVGALPTPALAYYCALQRAPGIVVTGSHIPFDRNGIKFYRADGEIDKADEQAILDAEVAVPAALSPAPLPAVDASALEAYVARYTAFFGEGALAGMRVALYEHSSVARDVLRTVFERLGAEVLSLGRTDTFVPIDTEAVRPEDIAQARAWAQAHRFDAILSTDGDADRPLIGDETGTWLRGDVVGILCAQYLHADVVVTPVSSNTAVEKCGAFRQVLRTRIGSPYVIAGMDTQRGAGRVVGYEANGGFLLGFDVLQNQRTLPRLLTRDAVLPILAVLAGAARRKVSIADMVSDLPERRTATDRLEHVPTERSAALVRQLTDDAAARAAFFSGFGPETRIDLTDGLHGRGLGVRLQWRPVP